jgi:hypothetical protein
VYQDLPFEGRQGSGEKKLGTGVLFGVVFCVFESTYLLFLMRFWAFNGVSWQ